MPELELLKGPLSEPMLAAVASLYGITDGKYGSVDHCRLLFNKNPFGPALHAFAREGQAYVGHYCLIPYDMLVDGTTVKAAKGEALHVADDHRRSQCGDLPTSSALLEGAQQLAQQEGVEVCYAIVGAPGVIRLFQRCSYAHQPFSVRDLLLPQTRALPLQRVMRVKLSEATARLSSSDVLREVSFEAVRARLPLPLHPVDGTWQPVLDPPILGWFGRAPSNRYFQLGPGVVWIAQTHEDWEVLCTFTSTCSQAQRTRLAVELRKAATERGIDRIRVPLVQGVEGEMVEAFRLLARREVHREISLVVRSSRDLGEANASPFLWSHF